MSNFDTALMSVISLRLQMLAIDLRESASAVRTTFGNRETPIPPLDGSARMAVESAIRELAWWRDHGVETVEQEREAA